MIPFLRKASSRGSLASALSFLWLLVWASPASALSFSSTTTAAGTNPTSVAIGDLNGDGKPDLAAANVSSHNVTVLLGDGSGEFTEALGSPFAVGSGPLSIAIGDLNGDGKPDLATANINSNDVTVLLGDGSGGFTEAAGSPVAVGSTPISVVIGNLNGDGKPDLATASVGASNVTVLLGDGSGGFSPAAGSPFAVGSSPNSLAIGDLNGDGKPDLATANFNSNDVTVLLGDGSGGFTEASGSPFAVGAGPHSVATADLNGDGKPDLATANGGSNNVTVLLGDGSGGFTEAAGSPFAVGSIPEAAAIGDLNGDGKPDLATASFISNNVTALLNTGQPAASPSPASLSFGDQQVSTTGTPQSVTLTNSGDAALHVTKVKVEGTNPEDTQVSSETCTDGRVLAGASCTIRVRFAPIDTGARQATLEVFSDDPTSPTAIPLAGTGTRPPPPNTTIVDHPSYLTTDSTPTFRFISDEPGSTFECHLDSSNPLDFAPCTSPYTTPALSDGSHSFEVRAIDPANNVDPTPDTVTFTVDATPPQVTISGRRRTKRHTPTFRFSFSEDVAAVRCKLDSAHFQPCHNPYRTPRLPRGRHTLKVKAIDDAGNRTSPPAKKTFKIVRKR